MSYTSNNPLGTFNVSTHPQDMKLPQ